MTDTSSLNKNLAPFVTASSVTLGGAATTILIYIIQQLSGITLPESVDEAILVLIEAIFAFTAHKLTSN